MSLRLRSVAATALEVFPVCLGTNVFGWTADREATFAVLDAYVAAGGNFIDTADVYPNWVPGNPPALSETLIGEWMAARGTRDQVILATKAGRVGGLGAEAVRRKAEASLRRLQTDRIDLYYAHRDDPDTPLEETLGAFDALVREGKARYVAASNYSAERFGEARAVSARHGLAPYVALQTLYSLVERGYEDELLDTCRRDGVSCLPYYSLAEGFLTGKYRPDDAATVESARAQSARRYLDARGVALLAVLDEISSARGVPIAAVSLAWLLAQPTVAAPIASARTPEQLEALLAAAELELSDDEVGRLSEAGASEAAPV